MPLTMPPTVKSYANKTIIVLDTPPSDPTAPTLVEINGGLFITCHTYGNGFLSQPTQNTGEGPRKACTENVPTEGGSVNYPAVEIEYSYDPQALGSSGAAGNEALELLTKDAEVYILEGPGLGGKTDAIVEGDVLTIHHMRCLVQRRGQTGEGEFDQFSVSQALVYVDGKEPQFDYAAPAA